MNKSIQHLLAAMLMVSAVCSAAENDHKTVITFRDQRNSVPLLSTSHVAINNKNDDRLNGHLQFTGWYSQSTNGKELGEAVAFHATQTEISNVIAFGKTNPAKIAGNYVVHNNDANAANAAEATITLNPRVQTYGAHAVYHQDLGGLTPGLWMRFDAPIAQARVDLRREVTNPVTGAGALLNNLAIASVLDGTGSNATQVALKHGKIASGARTATGVADVAVALGYNFVDSETAHVGLNAKLIIPTGTKVTAEHVLEPVVGNKRHWGLGAGLNADASLWNDKDQELKFLVNADYAYLFEGTEKRVVGVKNQAGAQYALGQAAGAAANTALFPLANVLAQDLKVKPGHQVDSVVALAYVNSGFNVDFGYNLFFKQEESAVLKNAWRDNVYGAALTDFDLGAPFAIATHAAGAAAINAADLDLKAASSAQFVSHKLFAGFGYTAKEWDYPLMVGVGAAYEFGQSKRAGAAGYSFWAKTGVSF